MISEGDLKKLDGVIADIIDRRDYYLGSFGEFVKSKISFFIAARYPFLQKNKDLGNLLRSLFRKEFMDFLIDNPELFVKRMPFPFLDTLGSIKQLRESPHFHKIAWIGEKHFVDVSDLPQHLSHHSTTNFNINSIKSPITEISSTQRELLPDGYHWLSPQDVALAMMEDFDPHTLSLKGEWLAHLKNKKSKQLKKKQLFVEGIEDLLSPTMILKCISAAQPEFLSKISDHSNTLTQAKWNSYLRYIIKTIFLDLNCKTREEILDCYTRIHKALATPNYRLAKKDKVFRQSLIAALKKAIKSIERTQSRFRFRINLSEDEFLHAFRRGIMLQIKDVSLKNPVYAFMKNHAHIGMKRIKRMKLTDNEKSRYEHLLCHEALLTRYSSVTPACDLFDLKSLCEDITQNNSQALTIVEVTVLKNSVLKNDLNESKVARNLAFGYLGNDVDDKYDFSDKELEHNPFIKKISSAREFAKEGLLNAAKTLKKHRNDQCPWFDIITATLTEFGFFNEVTITDRITVIGAIMTGESDSLIMSSRNELSKINKASSEASKLAALSKLNTFLCIAASAPIPDSHHMAQKRVFEALFSLFSSIDIKSNDFISEYIITLISLSSVITQSRRQDLFDVLKSNRRDYPSSSPDTTRRDYGIFSSPHESLKDALLDIECSEQRRLFLLYAICTHPVNHIIDILDDDISDWVHKINKEFEIGLQPILRHYFASSNIDPFTYLLTCPEWHHSHVMEMISA